VTSFQGGGVSPPQSQERSRGAFLGLAVGDALGATLEFAEVRAPDFPALAAGPHVDVVGGGPFRLVPGQVTDDTQMACCLAAALAADGGRYDVVAAADRYVKWQEHAFDIGEQTAAALNAIREGAPPSLAGRHLWARNPRRPTGNGSLMRTAPIGVLLARDAPGRRAASLADSAITHYDPRCRLACAAFNAALAAAVLGAGAASELREAALAELSPAAALLLAEGEGAEACSSAVRQLEEDLELSARDDPHLYSPPAHLHRNRGFVRVAFRLAFWEV
jgi:ADP-ribosylglycohydrolase